MVSLHRYVNTSEILASITDMQVVAEYTMQSQDIGVYRRSGLSQSSTRPKADLKSMWFRMTWIPVVWRLELWSSSHLWLRSCHLMVSVQKLTETELQSTCSLTPDRGLDCWNSWFREPVLGHLIIFRYTEIAPDSENQFPSPTHDKECRHHIWSNNSFHTPDMV